MATRTRTAVTASERKRIAGTLERSATTGRQGVFNAPMLRPRRLVPAGLLLGPAATAAIVWLAAAPSRTEAAAPARWRSLAKEIAVSWSRLQNRNGTFRDYVY